VTRDIRSLFKIDYPIIQGGMIWVSGWKLASAVSNNGGLGLIGAGSMYPEVLKEHIEKCKRATSKPFGVNVPMLYPNIDEIIQIIIDSGVKIVFTSAGNPAKYTALLKSHGITVAHVVSNLKFALKAQDSGVDAIVAEGFEAGGHNGREESTSMVLIPTLREQIHLPLIAAGGIGNGQSMLAAFALGADGVQIGSRFVMSEESSAHDNFKNIISQIGDGQTYLTLKELAPVRLVRNKFFEQVMQAYQNSASKDELIELLSRGRAKKGMFEGDLEEGELEIGQVSAYLNKIQPVNEIMKELVEQYNYALDKIKNM
jgi:enoyl-[acyl-carrier protein] reductase II